MLSVCVLGAGKMGTALSEHIARNGFDVKLWVRRRSLWSAMQGKRANVDYFPSYKLSDNILVINDLKQISNSEVIVFALPSRVIPNVLSQIKDMDINLNNRILVSAAKGLLTNPIRRVTESFKEFFPSSKVAVISGPNIASEILKGLPTTTTIAAESSEVLQVLRNVFESESLKLYLTKDVVGTELCGSLKNVVTIGVGIVDGLGLGKNLKGVIVVEGYLEVSKLIIKMGGSEKTLLSPAGLQDLLVASFSGASRNYKLGVLLGQGYSLERIIREFDKITFEGQKTAKIAYELAKTYGVEAPLIEMIYSTMYKSEMAIDSFKKFWGKYRF